MENIKNELKKIVCQFFDKQAHISDEVASIKLGEEKWSLKEVIGHLIDSASNNHQRFVRLQLEKNLHFPAYHYDWIKVEKINLMAYSDLLLLWKQYNLLLVHIIHTLDKKCLKNSWQKEDNTQITLEALIIDYLRHLKEHLQEFEEKIILIKNKKS